jgi:hypothetical protein
MKVRWLILGVMIALTAASAFAHGDKKHIAGTIEKISAQSVVVKTTDGKSVEVKLVPTTAYVLRTGNQDKPAKLSDLEVGDRVVIHATPNGDSFNADQIKFSASSVKPKS